MPIKTSIKADDSTTMQFEWNSQVFYPEINLACNVYI